MKVKKVWKYATGEVIPRVAVYLCTKVQTEFEGSQGWGKCWLVWHYFLVEVEE